MDIALYLEQLGEIGGYFLEQFNFDNLFQYSEEAILIFGVLFLIWFVVRYIKRKKAVAEFIDNGICLLIKFPPMSDIYSEISDIIKCLYDDFYTIYGRKYFWSLEVLIKKDRNHFFLYLPEKVYRNWNVSFPNDVKTEIVSNAREKFIDGLDENVMGFEMELSKDFIFPILASGTNDKRLNSFLENDEWIMFQILCRPAGRKWLDHLEKYKNNLLKGRNPSMVYRGCSGGFFSVIIKFFIFLGDTLTTLIHGSRVEKKDNEHVEQGQSTNTGLEDKIRLIDTKKSQYACETLIRVCSYAEDKERNYFLLDKVLSRFINEDGERSNSFIVKKMFNKIKSSIKNYYFLCGMDASVVDILNIKELVDILRRIT